MGLFETLAGPVGGLVSGVVGGIMQNNANNKNIEFAREQMNTQRQWALQDWDKQNAYNSPAATMQRLKDAGLNPNLVYGNGSAITTASPVRGVESAKATVQPLPNVVDSMLRGFMAMYDLQNTEAKTDNLKAQIELAKANARLALARTAGTHQQMSWLDERKNFLLENLQQKNRNLHQQEVMNDKRIDYEAREDSRKSTRLVMDAQSLDMEKQRLAMDLKRGNMSIAQGGQAILESMQRVIESQARTSNLGVAKMVAEQQLNNLKTTDALNKAKTIYEQYKARLTKTGSTTSDNWIFRQIENFMDEIQR